MNKLVSFENTFIDDSFEESDAVAICFIDGFPEDENASGTVIAQVILTKSHDIVVAWHENAYRLDKTVLALIDEAKEKLVELYVNKNEKYDKKPCVPTVEYIDFIDSSHLNKLWYAGNVAAISYLGYKFIISTRGEVRANLLTGPAVEMESKVIQSVVDRDESGEFLKRMHSLIEDDDDLENTENLEVFDENWLEVQIIDGNGNNVDIPDNAGVLEAETIVDAVSEVLTSIDDWLDLINKK